MDEAIAAGLGRRGANQGKKQAECQKFPHTQRYALHGGFQA